MERPRLVTRRLSRGSWPERQSADSGAFPEPSDGLEPSTPPHHEREGGRSCGLSRNGAVWVAQNAVSPRFAWPCDPGATCCPGAGGLAPPSDDGTLHAARRVTPGDRGGSREMGNGRLSGRRVGVVGSGEVGRRLAAGFSSWGHEAKIARAIPRSPSCANGLPPTGPESRPEPSRTRPRTGSCSCWRCWVPRLRRRSPMPALAISAARS